MKQAAQKRKLWILILLAGLLLLLGAGKMALDIRAADRVAGEGAQTILAAMDALPPEEAVPHAADRAPDDGRTGPMPEVEIDGEQYIGTIELPTLDLRLPVHSEWDEQAAKTAPCRYVGSAYDGSMIIAGHNLKKHFSRIRDLKEGDEVIFTDVRGAVFRYAVSGFESIEMHDIDGMLAGDWDLTLFTCDASRVRRTTVRCIEMSYTPAPEGRTDGAIDEIVAPEQNAEP